MFEIRAIRILRKQPTARTIYRRIFPKSLLYCRTTTETRTSSVPRTFSNISTLAYRASTSSRRSRPKVLKRFLRGSTLRHVTNGTLDRPYNVVTYYVQPNRRKTYRLPLNRRSSNIPRRYFFEFNNTL